MEKGTDDAIASASASGESATRAASGEGLPAILAYSQRENRHASYWLQGLATLGTLAAMMLALLSIGLLALSLIGGIALGIMGELDIEEFLAMLWVAVGGVGLLVAAAGLGYAVWHVDLPNRPTAPNREEVGSDSEDVL